MIDITPESFGIPISVPSEHGLLHGQLALRPDGYGLVVLAHAAMALDARDDLLADRLRHAGLSTFSVDLVAKQEEHFSDRHNNVPLLARRLLDFLGLIKNQIMMGELREQPIGLYAANATSPVAVRVAALRDHDIAAVVCRDGLIDLAGVLYLRSLKSPLLVLAEENDSQHVASSQRALLEVSGTKQLRLIPDMGLDFAASSGFEAVAQETSQWFVRYLGANSADVPT